MNATALALLQDITRLGSFAAVAAQRGVDPSRISRQLAALEAELGIRIFQRSTRRLALTEAGEAYLARAAPLVEALARLSSEARAGRAEASGTLRLTASVTFGQRCIMPLLPAFRARHPGVALDCDFTDATADLIAGRIDLAIRMAPAIEGDLIVTRLMRTRYRVVATPGYLARMPPPERPADLAEHRVLMFNLPAFRRRWLFRDAAGAEQAVPIAGDITLAPAAALREGALAGLGPVLLPDWLIDADIAAGTLTHLLPAWQVTATGFDTAAWAVYPSHAFLPAKTRVMIDFLRQHLARPATPRP